MNNPHGATLQHMCMWIFLLGQWRSYQTHHIPSEEVEEWLYLHPYSRLSKTSLLMPSVDWYNEVHMCRSALQLAVLVYSVASPCIGSLRKSNHIMRLLTTNNNVYRHHIGQKSRPLLEFLELCETHSREKERNIILHHSLCADSVSMLVRSQDATGIWDGGTV